MTAPTYYEVLGVPKNATDAEIKKAFRKCASKHHPDREGGDAEKMKEAQAAYDCLSDAHRRAVYDESGIDAGDVSIKTDALDVLTEKLDRALEEESPDCISAVRGQLLGEHSMAAEAISEAERKMKWLRRRRGRFSKHKPGDNLIDRLIDKKIEKNSKAINESKRAMLVQAEALLILDDYSALHLEPEIREIGNGGTVLQRLARNPRL
jgi:curved DNA-binding protein CbpA